MNFIEKIDKLIDEAESERQKCFRLRGSKQRHIDYVSDRINSHIKELAQKYPEDPGRSMAESLSKVPDFISDSFDYIDRVQLNATVAITAYQKVKDEYIAQQNEEAQSEQAKKETKKTPARKKSQPKRKIRDVGTRPEDKLKSRKKQEKTSEEKSPNS